MEEAFATESAAANTRAVRLARSATHQKHRTVPVHQEEIVESDSSEDEEVERLGADRLRQRSSRRTEGCASCGGPHARQQCRFRGAQCRACGKMGHIARACYSQCQAGVNGMHNDKESTATTYKTTKGPYQSAGWKNSSKASRSQRCTTSARRADRPQKD